MSRFSTKLDDLAKRNRLRALHKPLGIDFTSNDYLGLKNHPDLRRAAIEALEAGINIGSGGSRLLRGHTENHEALEARAAEFFGAQKALYFSTGFQANMALLTSLPSRHDVIIFDEYVHASTRDGIAASYARAMKVSHNDLAEFERALKKEHKNRRINGQIWLCIESLYSMDGDVSPIRALYDLAVQYDAILIIDEAHATGVNGPCGRGMARDLNQKLPENMITIHTCGKALGTAGGLVCASSDIIDTLINTARPFIYSTAPMPLQAVLTEKAIEIVASEEGNQRRSALMKNVRFARQILSNDNLTHIIPIILGADQAALSAAQILQTAGYDVRAIRPPTVPEGTARLRLSLSANMDIDGLQKFFDTVHVCTNKKVA